MTKSTDLIRHIRETNVCVVGGCGFLGSHLVDHLIEDRGCRVLVLDNLINGHRKFVNPKAKFQWFDIRDSEESLRSLLVEEKIEYLFNYAAEPYIPVSFARPLHVFNINAFAVLKVLNAAQEVGVKAILQVSSAEIYGQMDGKINEDDRVVPHSTYGVSKVAADGLVQVRWKEAKTPAIAMRQFNCVGARETHPYVIPEIIRQIDRLDGDGTIELGNNSSRDFQYAGDAVRMAVLLLENGEFGEVYNMGSESTIKIYDLAVKIGKLMGKDIRIHTDQKRVRPWEIWHLLSDNTKLNKVIGEYHGVHLDHALQETINYYYENGKRWDFE